MKSLTDFSRSELVEMKHNDELIDKILYSKKQREILELQKQNSISEIVEDLAETYNLTKGVDYEKNFVKKSGLAKIKVKAVPLPKAESIDPSKR